MTTKGSWKDVPGNLVGEIEIKFLSSGYYDPGKNYGLAENCYPPEGSDERVLDAVDITLAGGETWTLPKEMAEEIFAHFQEQVDDEEIEHEPDEPDWDSIREQREESRLMREENDE